MKAQSFPAFNISEIWPASGTHTSVDALIPGTAIPISITTTQGVSLSGGDLLWASGSAGLTIDWTITIGELGNTGISEDVELTLVDFDRVDNISALESLT